MNDTLLYTVIIVCASASIVLNGITIYYTRQIRKARKERETSDRNRIQKGR